MKGNICLITGCVHATSRVNTKTEFAEHHG